METDNAGLVGGVGALVTMLFIWVGLAMAHDPPAPADAAVGKGLLALAGAAAIITVAASVLAYQGDRRNAEKARAEGVAASKPTYLDTEGA